MSCSGPARNAPSGKFPPIAPKQAAKLSAYAKKHLGQPYSYGGMSARGWDCSGFVYNMYQQVFNISLPRSAAQMKVVTQAISSSKARPGDLVFFSNGANRPTHVGIYLNKHKFIHVSKSIGVTISSLREDYYRRHFIGFGRLNTIQLALR